MFDYFWPWGSIEFLAALVILGLAVLEVLFQGIPARAHRQVLLLLVVSALWVFDHAVETSTGNTIVKDITFKLQLPGIITIATIYLVFISRYFSSNEYFTSRNIVLLYIIPVLSLVLAMTNGIHHIIWTDLVSQPSSLYFDLYDKGIGYWVGIGYAFVIFTWSIFILGRRISRFPEPVRVDAWILMIGATIIATSAIISIASPGGTHQNPLSITALGLVFGYTTVTFGFFFTRMRNIMPFARQAVFDSIANPIIVLDNIHRVVDMNKACMELMGNKVVLSGKLVKDVLYPKAIDLNNAFVSTSSTPQEISWEDDNGNIRYFEVMAFPIVDSVLKILGKIIIMKDITLYKKNEDMEKRLEKQAYLTNRLATIGDLALGIAQEINTPLTSVIHLSRLLARKDISIEIKKDIDTIYHEAKRATVIARDLMVFSKSHSLVKQSTQINKVIADVLRIRKYSHKKKRIKVEVNFDIYLPEIVVDYYQIQEVFLNIVLNAEYFLTHVHKRKMLTITTEVVDKMIRASFTDNGTGIPAENLDRIFDPFFTTKPVGEGIGLGLSISYGIVSAHGGRIYTDSILGKGTRFVVELPNI